MSFLDIIVDVRLKIYSELLVLPDAICLEANDFRPALPFVSESRSFGLHPAILRVCKVVYEEASPLLYSKNLFRLTEESCDGRIEPLNVLLGSFLDQIGGHASFLRHICIPFPTILDEGDAQGGTDGEHFEHLQRLSAGTNIRTIEYLVQPEHFNFTSEDWPNVSGALNEIDSRLKKACPSLKEIKITFQKYRDCEPSEGVTARLHQLGWIFRVERLPNKVWSSHEYGLDFETEEELRMYEQEQLRRELELEARKEEEDWREEYYRRRRDPYWKNDSDYD